MKALGPLGVKGIMEYGTACGFGRKEKPDFWIAQGRARRLRLKS